jgi:hypothetical protein
MFLFPKPICKRITFFQGANSDTLSAPLRAERKGKGIGIWISEFSDWKANCSFSYVVLCGSI